MRAVDDSVPTDLRSQVRQEDNRGWVGGGGALNIGDGMSSRRDNLIWFCLCDAVVGPVPNDGQRSHNRFFVAHYNAFLRGKKKAEWPEGHMRTTGKFPRAVNAIITCAFIPPHPQEEYFFGAVQASDDGFFSPWLISHYIGNSRSPIEGWPGAEATGALPSFLNQLDDFRLAGWRRRINVSSIVNLSPPPLCSSPNDINYCSELYSLCPTSSPHPATDTHSLPLPPISQQQSIFGLSSQGLFLICPSCPYTLAHLALARYPPPPLHFHLPTPRWVTSVVRPT